MTTIRIPADFPVQPLASDDDARYAATCGTCGLIWDDGLATAYTPAPGGRCPFEAFHGTLANGLDVSRLLSEFPDFDLGTLPAIPSHWVDTSWHNDVCPSFQVSPDVSVFVDYADASLREADGRQRFTVCSMDGEGGHLADGVYLDTDDWQGALAAALALQFVANLRRELTAEQFDEVLQGNVGISDKCCASHDVCDANMPMADAFETVAGHEIDPSEDSDASRADVTLWNAAWETATPRLLTAGSPDVRPFEPAPVPAAAAPSDALPDDDTVGSCFTPVDHDSGDRLRLRLSPDDAAKVKRGEPWAANVVDLRTGRTYAARGIACSAGPRCFCDAEAFEVNAEDEAAEQPQTVLDLYLQAFTTLPDETYRQALADMPLDSTCGDDCREAINSAAAFRSKVLMAWGPQGYGARVTPDAIALTALQVCGTFICG